MAETVDTTISSTVLDYANQNKGRLESDVVQASGNTYQPSVEASGVKGKVRIVVEIGNKNTVLVPAYHVSNGKKIPVEDEVNERKTNAVLPVAVKTGTYCRTVLLFSADEDGTTIDEITHSH